MTGISSLWNSKLNLITKGYLWDLFVCPVRIVRRFARSLAPSGMTTSISNVSAVPALREERAVTTANISSHDTAYRRHSLASRLAFLTICVMIVLTTLAYGTVHYWALAVFTLTAAGLVCFWCVDWVAFRSVQISVNSLQWPVLGLIVIGGIQLLPLRSAVDPSGLGLPLSHSLSLDP